MFKEGRTEFWMMDIQFSFSKQEEPTKEEWMKKQLIFATLFDSRDEENNFLAMNTLMMDPKQFERRLIKLRSGNIYMKLVNVHGIQVKDGQLSIRTDQDKPITLDIA